LYQPIYLNNAFVVYHKSTQAYLHLQLYIFVCENPEVDPFPSFAKIQLEISYWQLMSGLGDVAIFRDSLARTAAVKLMTMRI